MDKTNTTLWSNIYAVSNTVSHLESIQCGCFKTVSVLSFDENNQKKNFSHHLH